jgi:hypothetical protein
MAAFALLNRNLHWHQQKNCLRTCKPMPESNHASAENRRGKHRLVKRAIYLGRVQASVPAKNWAAVIKSLLIKLKTVHSTVILKSFKLLTQYKEGSISTNLDIWTKRSAKGNSSCRQRVARRWVFNNSFPCSSRFAIAIGKEAKFLLRKNIYNRIIR